MQKFIHEGSQAWIMFHIAWEDELAMLIEAETGFSEVYPHKPSSLLFSPTLGHMTASW